MNIRMEIENSEELLLSSFATLSRNSKGRQSEEEECNIRTCFQRDKDRIVYSKAFRRLKHKTQVFISPEGDHYRTRLTHTLEVSNIGRTIARSIRLNEDLTEAIALGHDLGHTPFGHAGEHVLNSICPHGFKHNLQSLRVVEFLEKGSGINLTYEVKDGIKNHTGTEIPSTLEGQIIRFADRIAYINHDIEDAIRAKILSNDSIPKSLTKILGKTSSERINNMIIDIIENSKNRDIISMSSEIQEAKNELRDFLFKNIYIDSIAKKEEIKAQNMIKELYVFLINNTHELPLEFLSLLSKNDTDKVVCDYIAGMTDRYAVSKFKELFVPASWMY